MIANKLKKGDEVRVIAPARSMSLISEETKKIAVEALESLGLTVTFGKHIMESDEFVSSSIESRIEDLHEAFRDDNVKAILTVIGGHNANQLLDHIDFDLIRNNPKILCGYSDITILSNAIYAKTGLVTYSGPHFSTFGIKKGNEYTVDYFRKCLMEDGPFDLVPSEHWSDDPWFLDQDNRFFIENEGYEVIHPGTVTGHIVGGNLCTFNLLQGTEYIPDLEGKILFIEDDGLTFPENFDRDLQSLTHQPGFDKVKGIVIGKFQVESKMTMEKLHKIIETKVKLKDLPVLAEVNFGHVNPIATLPIGGEVELTVDEACSKIVIVGH